MNALKNHYKMQKIGCHYFMIYLVHLVDYQEKWIKQIITVVHYLIIQGIYIIHL